MKSLESEQILDFLDKLGKRVPDTTALYLLGGSALCLLGSPRPTLDIDYVGDDLKKDGFQILMEEIAQEIGLDVEAVPIDRFIPALIGSRERNQYYRTFGNVAVYIFDPYSIALSKVDRGFDTDIEDVVFLLRQGYINIEALEIFIRESITHAHEFDIIPDEIRSHLDAVRKRLST